MRSNSIYKLFTVRSLFTFRLRLRSVCARFALCVCSPSPFISAHHILLSMSSQFTQHVPTIHSPFKWKSRTFQGLYLIFYLTFCWIHFIYIFFFFFFLFFFFFFFFSWWCAFFWWCVLFIGSCICLINNNISERLFKSYLSQWIKDMYTINVYKTAVYCEPTFVGDDSS